MSTAQNLSWLSGRYVSDGGLETDLIFNHGVDLPEFASFPLRKDYPLRGRGERHNFPRLTRAQS